jgi:hypothetical protein
MSNVNAPRGFTPVKHSDGSPYRGEMLTIVPKNGADIYIGDAITLDTGTADAFASGDTCLGVCVGVGKIDPATGYYATAANPDNLNEIWYDDSDHTNTQFVIFYVPAEGMVFEVKASIDATAAVKGTVYDVAPTAGDALTGRSKMSLTTDSNHDLVVYEIPHGPGNDPASAYASYYVYFA